MLCITNECAIERAHHTSFYTLIIKHIFDNNYYYHCQNICYTRINVLLIIPLHEQD